MLDIKIESPAKCMFEWIRYINVWVTFATPKIVPAQMWRAQVCQPAAQDKVMSLYVDQTTPLHNGIFSCMPGRQVRMEDCQTVY